MREKSAEAVSNKSKSQSRSKSRTKSASRVPVKSPVRSASRSLSQHSKNRSKSKKSSQHLVKNLKNSINTISSIDTKTVRTQVVDYNTHVKYERDAYMRTTPSKKYHTQQVSKKPELTKL